MGKNKKTIVETLLENVNWDEFKEPEEDKNFTPNATGTVEYEDSEAWAFQNSLRGNTAGELRSYAATNIRKSRRRSDVIREALDLGVNLQAYIPSWQLSELIRIATESHTAEVERAKKSVHDAADIFLRKLLTHRIKSFYRDFGGPNSAMVPRTPGFLYVFYSEKLGYKLDFWAEPDIPRYFKQQSEVTLIDNDPKMQKRFRSRIETYYNAIGVRHRVEMRLAYKLYGVKTAQDLANKDPEMFDIYVKHDVKSLGSISARQRLLNTKSQ